MTTVKEFLGDRPIADIEISYFDSKIGDQVWLPLEEYLETITINKLVPPVHFEGKRKVWEFALNAVDVEVPEGIPHPLTNPIINQYDEWAQQGVTFARHLRSYGITLWVPIPLMVETKISVTVSDEN